MEAPVDGLQDPYLETLYLSTSEHLKLYNKAIFGLPESDWYDLTRSKWTDFYQEFEDYISKFGFKPAVLILTARYSGHVSTEVKNIIMSYPFITQMMVDSHCEILWADNSVAHLGCHSTTNYAAGLYDASKQEVITQQHLMSKMIGLLIKNSLTTDAKRKLRAFKYAYTFNTQDYGAAMFFVIVKWCNLIHAQDAQTSSLS